MGDRRENAHQGSTREADRQVAISDVEIALPETRNNMRGEAFRVAGPAPSNPGRCRQGCGRRVNPSLNPQGVPYDTCCRACAMEIGGHDPGCVEGDGPQFSDPEVSTAVGIALSSVCGDVLGSGVVGWSSDQVHSMFPRGYGAFQRTRQGYGAYTDATQMSVALMISLVKQRVCNAKHVTDCYCLLYEKWRGYSPTTANIMEMLQMGRIDYSESGVCNLPQGSHGNGGAVRIAPVGFVYRNCNSETLKDAVFKAIQCTHVHPEAIDAAYVQAAAVAILSKCRIRIEGGDLNGDMFPQDLLEDLKLKALTDDMQGKLDALISGLCRWDTEGPSRKCFQDVISQVSEPFQAKGTEAVACALWVMCTHWEQPSEAVIEAVSCGGAAASIGCMTGALVGARHGWHWIPVGWFNNIENGPRGREDIMAVAAQLTLLPTPPSV